MIVPVKNVMILRAAGIASTGCGQNCFKSPRQVKRNESDGPYSTRRAYFVYIFIFVTLVMFYDVILGWKISLRELPAQNSAGASTGSNVFTILRTDSVEKKALP